VKHCCDDKAEALRALRVRQRRMLTTVLAINSTMFVIEVAGGLFSRSSALLGDSLDMFGDAAVYALSLYALDRGELWRARTAIAKGIVMLLLGLGVVFEAGAKLLADVIPAAPAMGGLGLLALAANLACLFLLFRHREDDINLRSAWICSRNDIIANGSVLLAAAAVWALEAAWPDLLVGLSIAALFLLSSTGVLRDGWRAHRAARG